MPDSSSQPSLIVGLGNPETRYEETRHNVGFQVIDRILAAVPARSVQEQRARNYIFWACRLAGRQLWLQKPLTYMNCSGDAIAALAKKHDLPPAAILVAFDDVDLPLGRIRLRTRGSSGGHRGVESIIAALGSDRFLRLRIGINNVPAGDAAVDYVLSTFAVADRPLVEEIVALSAEAALLAFRRGIHEAMNRYNGITAGRQDD